MVLLRCYIENFGNLSQFKLNFNNDITSVLEKNGFGKSTLTAFIRVMFYGMAKTGKSVENNDRRRYQPWNGGTYGGYLEFSYDSVKYRIERSFGESPKFDRFRLYTLEPLAASNRYSEKIGEELFGIDADSFEKCVLFLQTQNSFSVTPGIKSMLMGITENVSDTDSVDSAIQQLKGRRSTLMSYRGKNGSIYDLSETISSLELSFAKAKKAKEQILEKNQQLMQAESDYQKTRAAYESVSDEIHHVKISDAHNHLADQREFLQQQELEIREQLRALECEADSVGGGQHSPSSSTLTAEETAQYSKLSRFFSSHRPPDEDELDYLEELTEKTEQLSAEITATESRIVAEPTKKSGICGVVFWVFAILALTAVGVGLYYDFAYLYLPAACCGLAAVAALCMWSYRKQGEKKYLMLNVEMDDLYAQLEETVHDAQLITDRYFRTKYSPRKAYELLKKYTETFLYLSDKANEGNSNGLVVFGKPERDIVRVQLMQRLDAIQNRLREFDDKHSLLCKSDIDVSSEQLQTQKQSLAQRMEQLNGQIIALNREISALQFTSDTYATLEDELFAAKQQRTAQLETVKLLDKAVEHLQLAQYTLTTEYINPLIAAFKYYVQELMDIPSDKVQIDSDFNMMIEVHGAHRELSYFSAGERDLFTVCMKLAVQDIVMKKCTFPLILDDPFSNLDEIGMSRAAVLLHRLSESRQILYFTCHPSRLI